MNHVWGRRLLRGGSSEAAFLPADGWLGPPSGAVGRGSEQASPGSVGAGTPGPRPAFSAEGVEAAERLPNRGGMALRCLLPPVLALSVTWLCWGVFRLPGAVMWQLSSLLLSPVPAVGGPPGHMDAQRSCCPRTCFSDRHTEVRWTEVTCPRARLPTVN